MRLPDCLFAFIAKLAKKPTFKAIVIWSLTHMTFALPLKSIIKNSEWSVFHHPNPKYKIHLLLLPRKAIKTPLELADQEPLLLKSLLLTVNQLVKDFQLENQGYRMIINGGRYQDFPLLHIHLVSGEMKKIAQLHENDEKGRNDRGFYDR